MAIMGSWNGFDFEVSPTAVRGFTGLRIKGGSETEDKVSQRQKYVQRTNSAATEIALSVYLNAYMGCNVRDEALRFICTAMEGATNYFYVGGKKLVTYKLMLVNAEITETEIAPNGTWIACKIDLSLKQCEKYGKTSGSGSSGSSGSKTPAKQTVKSEGITGKLANAFEAAGTAIASGAKNLADSVVSAISGNKAAASKTRSKAESQISNVVATAQKPAGAGKAATKTAKKTATGGGGGGKLAVTMVK